MKPGYKDNLQSIPEQKDEFILVINNSETNYFEMSLKISTKNWTGRPVYEKILVLYQMALL